MHAEVHFIRPGAPGLFASEVPFLKLWTLLPARLLQATGREEAIEAEWSTGHARCNRGLTFRRDHPMLMKNKLLSYTSDGSLLRGQISSAYPMTDSPSFLSESGQLAALRRYDLLGSPEVRTVASLFRPKTEAKGLDLFRIDINRGARSTGLDVVNLLRGPSYREAPMIACTTYAMPKDERRFLEADFDAYFAKPFRAGCCSNRCSASSTKPEPFPYG